MSTALDSMDASKALSSLTLTTSKSRAWNVKPLTLNLGADEVLGYPRASFLGLPLEIRDMIYELLAGSYKVATTPVLLTSNKPGYKHLVVAGGRAKVCRDTLLLRCDHCYNNLLLVNRQINAEIAEAARIYLPFSIRVGTRSACLAFNRCFEPEDTMAGHLNSAKTIIVRWVDATRMPRLAPNEIYSTDMEEPSAYWSECSAWFYQGLTFFFDWYKPRIHEENPPRLIIKVEDFLRASERRGDPHLRNALVSLNMHISSDTMGSGCIPIDYMRKIGYILSDKTVSLLRTHRLRYPMDDTVPETAMGDLRTLLPWGHLGHLNMDKDLIRYSPQVDFRQIVQ
jgi:hypothetical protein